MKRNASQRNTYIRLLGYLIPYWRRTTIILFLSALSAYIAVLPTQILGIAVDEIRIADTFLKTTQSEPLNVTSSEDSHSYERENPIPLARPLITTAQYIHKNWFASHNVVLVTLAFLGASFLLMHSFGSGVNMFHGFITTELGQRLVYDMRNQLYNHIQRFPLTYFENNKTGDIMSRLMNDVNSLEQAIVGPVITFITDMFKFGWIVFICIKLDVQLTVIALIVCPFISLCTYNFGKQIRKVFRVLREKTGDLNALIQDNISGIRVIAGFAKEDEELKRFEKKNYENYSLHVRILRLVSTLRPIVDLITETGAVVVICLGGYKVLNGELSAGTFVIFFPYLQMMYGPITGVTRFYNQVQRAIASTERVFDVLDTPIELKDAANALDLPAVRGVVEFRNVSFSYQNNTEVLSDITIHARPGQMIAFVGSSGSGKTTITKLIPRFYDPTKGDIFIDGYNIKNVKLHSLRKQLAMVLQETFLFNDTVRVNIAYAHPDASDHEVEEAARAANAHEFIVELPNGYDSLIGERGVKLSGGQKQRIAIARAILANPRILILDEATSSVDTKTEQLIQHAIDRLVENRTTFVIAHRLSTILHADLIVVLEKGRIVETGLHQELLASGGLYKNLYEMQFYTEERPKQEIIEREVEKAEGPVLQDPLLELDESPQRTKWS
ncbi:MAG: ABC transporter ATP-binding protein/permease [Candidatus Brocadiaceae bacterium]|nr:ABC transporter ATP-binding protein/permease [Candidatus Brocadiaceae bacterium]